MAGGALGKEARKAFFFGKKEAKNSCLCCLITTQVKVYPFEVALEGLPVSVALADQARSQDWRARQARRKGQVSPAELAEIRAKIRALLG